MDRKVYCRKCKRRYSYERYQRIEKIIEYFTLEIPAHRVAKFMKINYRTVLSVYQKLRERIAEESLKELKRLSGEIEIDDAYFGGKQKGQRGRAAAGKVLVLGMLERHGKVFTTLPENLGVPQVAKIIKKYAEKGSIFYTDKYRSYNSLVFFGKHLRLDHAHEFVREGNIHINGLEGFWSFAKERLLQYHGVSKKHFYAYLKELEFRYNHRQENLYHTFRNFYFMSKNT